jgi:uncharacterized protein with HEPN domain
VKDNILYLIHIIERIERIEEYVVGGRDVFMQSQLIQDAVIRNFEVIGEAAGRLSEELRRAYPATPWKSVIGLRNVLIHNYAGVDIDEVWRIVEQDLPRLERDVLAIRASLEGV